MPKKTRSEKIIADLRRKLQTTGANAPLPSTAPTEKPAKIHLSATLNNNSIKVPTLTSTRTTTATDYSYVWTDLHRIIILTISAVGFEFLLYIILPRFNLLSR